MNCILRWKEALSVLPTKLSFLEENDMYLCALVCYLANPLICNLLPQIIMKFFINNKNLLWYHYNVAVNHVRIILPVIWNRAQLSKAEQKSSENALELLNYLGLESVTYSAKKFKCVPLNSGIVILKEKSIFSTPLLKSKGAVHILGKICPRSDPDIAHMEYSMDPLQFIYKPLLLDGHQGTRFGEILTRFGHSNPMESHIMVPLPMFRPNIILFT